METTRQNRRTAHRVAVARIAVATLGLGSLSASAIAAGTAGAASSVVISTAKNAKLGTILVSGKTVYTLKPSKTACSAQCFKIWPEVLLPKGVTKVTAGKGVNAAKLGTVRRSGGALQVTYNGKALYLFSGDTAAGQVHGDVTDTWGKWSAVVTAKPATSSSSSGSTTGGSTSGSGGTAF